ncbi:hypothetical protein [Pseudomonas synxantha]|uniref:hypothetical protein n=1 Tax=Pseudomonas synxantha TaxID=47883 RepID=UPI00345D6D9D
MFHRYVRPVGYWLVVVGTISLLFSAFELFAGRDSLFAVAKSAAFVLVGVWVIKSSVKPSYMILAMVGGFFFGMKFEPNK